MTETPGGGAALPSDFERGLEVRREFFGADRLEAAFASPDALTRKFQRLITTACFGTLWADAAMGRRDRSLVTMALVAAQHRFTEFETHVRLAVRNGCTASDIEQLVLHVTVYCGVPTGVEAFRVAHRVLQELGLLVPAD